MVITKSGGTLYYRPAGSTSNYTTMSGSTITLNGNQDAYLAWSMIYQYTPNSDYYTQYITITINNFSIGRTYASNILHFTSRTSGNYIYYDYKFPLPLSDGYDYNIAYAANLDYDTDDFYATLTINTTRNEVPKVIGETLIDGVFHNIRSGKVLVDGTSYTTYSGKIMTNGTTYDIGGLAPITPPSVTDLFQDMVVDDINGYNTSTSSRTAYTTYPTDSKTYYLLSLCNGYLTIAKVNSGQPFPELMICGSDGGISLDMSTTPIKYYPYNGFGWINYRLAGASAIFGRTFAMVRFPHYTDAEVDACLLDCKAGRLAGNNSNTASDVQTTRNYGNIIITAKDNYIDARRSSNWEKLSGTTTDAASISGSTLTCGSNYAASIAVLADTTTREALPVSVTITGTGNMNYVYVTLNGTQYTRATSGISIPQLSELGYYINHESGYAASTVKWNGQTIASVSGGYETGGSFTIPYGYTSVSIALAYTARPGMCTITITAT